MAARKRGRDDAAQALRLDRAVTAGGERLAELVSYEERVSAALAMSLQLQADGAADEEVTRVLAVYADFLLPDLRKDARTRRRAVIQAVALAARPKLVRKLAAWLEDGR